MATTSTSKSGLCAVQVQVCKCKCKCMQSHRMQVARTRPLATCTCTCTQYPHLHLLGLPCASRTTKTYDKRLEASVLTPAPVLIASAKERPTPRRRRGGRDQPLEAAQLRTRQNARNAQPRGSTGGSPGGLKSSKKQRHVPNSHKQYTPARNTRRRARNKSLHFARNKPSKSGAAEPLY